jgi:hypothetical protein
MKQFSSDGNKLFGFYRARVVEVDVEEDGEKNKYGCIRVFVPDVLEGDDFDEFNSGIKAYPATSIMGGYNSEDGEDTSWYSGSIIVPPLNSYIFVFFEGGNIDQCFYFSAFNSKIHPILPENRGVSLPHKVYTLLKTGAGRSIVICDSPDQARVEITGRKRKIKDGPVGDKSSVYTIDGNQTTILLDERPGKEKLLIRSHKKDFINFDIENQELEIFVKNGIKIKTDGLLNLQAKAGIEISSIDGDVAITAGGSLEIVMRGAIRLLSEMGTHMRSAALTAIDAASSVFIQTGVSTSARESEPEDPEGNR